VLENQDDTILILGNTEEKNSSPYTHDDGFETVLEEHCSSHVILTSVKALTYRVEVFEKQELIDAIEFSAKENDEAAFVKHYTKAHEMFKQKFCHPHKNKTAAIAKPIKEYKVAQSHSSKQFIPQMTTPSDKRPQSALPSSATAKIWKYVKEHLVFLQENQNAKLTMVLLVVVLTVVFLGRVLMCQENILDYFLDKEEKVAYYKQTESLCHKLEKGCLNLAEGGLVDKSLFTAKRCKVYCKEGDISWDVCRGFLPHFKVKHSVVPKEEVNIVPVENKPKVLKEKLVFMQTEPFELLLDSGFELTIQNPTMHACKITVKDLIVNESEHDEIVQFRAGVSHLDLIPKEIKKFKLFLEESYYRQFRKGKYTGSIVFSVLFENGKKETVKKSFFFEVK